MQQYPLKADDIIDSADIAAGRTNLIFPYKDYLSQVNNAFFTGFIVASLNTKEEADSLTEAERALLLARAVDKAALLCGAEDPKALEFVISALTEDMEDETPNG